MAADRGKTVERLGLTQRRMPQRAACHRENVMGPGDNQGARSSQDIRTDIGVWKASICISRRVASSGYRGLQVRQLRLMQFFTSMENWNRSSVGRTSNVCFIAQWRCCRAGFASHNCSKSMSQACTQLQSRQGGNFSGTRQRSNAQARSGNLEVAWTSCIANSSTTLC